MGPNAPRARRALILFFALPAALVASQVWSALAADDAVGEYCFLVADKGGPDDADLITRVDTGIANPPLENEVNVGFSGTTKIEALALQPGTEVLFGIDANKVGTINTSTGAFTLIGTLGSGSGSLGSISFNDADGVTFDPATGQMYASIRRSGPDLLIEVNPTTGQRVLDAFPGGAEYVPITPINGLTDLDDITIGGRQSDLIDVDPGPDQDLRFPMWASLNEGGDNPRIIKLNRTGDTFSGGTTDVGPTVEDDIEGLSWGNTGLWASSGKVGTVEALWRTDPDTGQVSNPQQLDNGSDYEGIACPPPAVIEVTVTPPTGLNNTGDQHTFTVTVTRDGDPVAGVVPTIELTGVGSIVSNGCASGTDALGRCTVTITSNQPGTSTLTATATASAGQGTAGTASGSATKTWIVLAKDACDTAARGALVTYDVSFTTGSAMTDVVVADDLPAELVFISATAINGVTPSHASGTVTWSFAGLPAGTHTGQVRARVAADAADGATATNTLRFAQGGHEVAATHALTVVPDGGECPGPRVTVTPATGLNQVGTTHTFTVLVEVDGSPRQGAVPTIQLTGPGSITSNGCAGGTNAAGTCTVTITSGATGTTTLTATFNLAVGQSSVAASDSAQKSWIDLDKSSACETAERGALVVYDVSFITGDPLTDVTVTDVLPDEVTFISASMISGATPSESNGTITWQFASLPAGTHSGTIQVRVDGDVAFGTEPLNALSFSWNGHEVDVEHTFTVVATDGDCPGLSVTVVPDTGLNLVGEQRVFTVTVTQDGAPAVGAMPTIELTGVGSIVSTTCTTGTDANGQCTVTVTSSVVGTSVVTATATNGVGASASDEGSTTWITLAKSANCDTAERGALVTYTVAFTTGDALSDVVVADVFPAGVVLESASTIAGVEPASTGGTVSWTFPSLPAGAYHGTISVRVRGDAPATVENPLAFSWNGHQVSVSESFSVVDDGGECPGPEVRVTPDTGLNLLDTEHTFTVTVLVDDEGAPGIVPTIELAGPGSIVHNGCAAGTDADGRCTVTITSAAPGTSVLTARVDLAVGDSTVPASDSAEKVWIDLDKSSACATAERGALVVYDLSFTTAEAMDDVTVTDVLPPEVELGSASSIEGVAPVVAGDTITWTFASLPAGTHTGQVAVRVEPATAFGAEPLNTLAFAWSGHTVEVEHPFTVVESGGDCPGPQITVTPKEALNNVNTQHEFTVRVFVDGEPAAGAVPEIALTGVGSIVTNGCADGTDQTGACTVTITSASAGVSNLTATYRQAVGDGEVVVSDSGDKTWVDFSAESTCGPVPAGALATFEVKVSATQSLDDVVVTFDLSDRLRFAGAEALAGTTPTTPAVDELNGAVVWQIPTLPAGESTATVAARVVLDAQPNEQIVNTVTMTHDGTTLSDTATVTVIAQAMPVETRAFGLRADLLGGGLVLGDPDIEATPDSDVTNPDELASIPNPLPGSAGPLVRLLSVQEDDHSTDLSSSTAAIASTALVDLDIPGVLRVQADSVVARSASEADIDSATSTATGSTVQNLRINGTQHGDISEPVTITVNDPVSGNLLAEVHVLERIATGAAAGVPQPEAGVFNTGLDVNGIHVVVYDLGLTPIDESSDIIVAHADSEAAFISGLECTLPGPRVSGVAFIAELFNVEPDLAHAIIGRVVLPSTGGAETEALADVDLPVGTADAATSSTEGSIVLDPASATARSLARVTALDLLGGTITARVVEATSESDLAGSSGDTTIADLVIGGTDVCDALGLEATCEPDPNTVLLLPGGPVLVMLNEQIPEPGGLTVNAVHIWILGRDNPFDLPVGAEIVVSSAHSDAHPSPE